MPTKEEGTVSQQQDNNTINSNGIKVYGSQNYVPKDVKSAIIVGDKNSISKTAKNVVVIGDGISANESETIYLGDVKINEKGIISNGDVIIDGGLDEVFPVLKTTEIDIIDGGIDAVRNYGGASKSRPIIDGGYESVNEIEP